MGVLKLFSSSTFDRNPAQTAIEFDSKNPDPSKYKINQYKEWQNPKSKTRYLIVDITYPNCVNYEGRKIMVYENCTIEQLKKQKLIDPHFSENKNFHSPIMRVEPTRKGWTLALMAIRNF